MKPRTRITATEKTNVFALQVRCRFFWITFWVTILESSYQQVLEHIGKQVERESNEG